MADVFISYSRKDRDFVRQLHDALAQQNRDTWVDWEDIPLTAEWLKEIYAGIEGADTFVFVISPDSVASETCRKEIAHAAGYNKRLVPIMRRDVPDKDVPEQLRPINWIFFRESDDFDAKVQELLQAIDTDLDWVKSHTRLLVRAIEWDKKKRDDSLALRGRDLREAEEWLAQAASRKESKPTPLQSQYIFASRRSATARQRMLLTGVTFALIVAIGWVLVSSGMGLFAWSQMNVRATAEAQAVFESKTAFSRELAINAISTLKTDPELSVLLALEAVRVSRTTQAEEALRQSVLASRLRSTLGGHTCQVTMAFSPNSTLIATASCNNVARVWDVNTGNLVSELSGHKGDWVHDLMFSPDSRSVVTASDDDTARIWEARTGRVIAELRGHTTDVSRARFAPNGKYVVTISEDGATRIWDARTGSNKVAFSNPTGGVPQYNWTVEFSPQSKYVAISRLGGNTKVWEVETGEAVADISGGSPVFNSDGTLLLTSTKDSIEKHDTRAWLLVAKVPWSSTPVAYSPDRRWIVSSYRVAGPAEWNLSWYGDTGAAIWNTGTGQNIALLVGHAGRLSDATFSPDSKYVVTASEDKTARIWETSTGKLLAELRAPLSSVGKVLFSPDGRFLATAGGDVRLWDATFPQEVVELHGHTSWVHSAFFSPDSNFVVTASEDTTARVWEVSTGRNIVTLDGRPDILLNAAFSPNGQLVLADYNKYGKHIWETSNGRSRLLEVSETGYLWASAASFNPDGKSVVIVTGFKNSVQIWDLASQQVVVEFNEKIQGVNSAVFSFDGKMVVTASDDKIARVWDAATGRVVTELRGHSSEVNTAVFSPDDKLVVTSSTDGTTRVWETATGKVLTVLRGHTKNVRSAVFNSDGKLVLTISDDATARVWDVGSGKLLTELRGNGVILNAALSPDSRLAVAATGDKTAPVWDVATGNIVAELRGHTGLIRSVAFSPNGRFIVTSSMDQTARIYPLEMFVPFERLIVEAQTRVTRKLTCQERQVYMHEATIGCPTATPFPIPLFR